MMSPGEWEAEEDEAGKASKTLLSQLPFDKCDYALLCYLKDSGGVLCERSQLKDTLSPRPISAKPGGSN